MAWREVRILSVAKASPLLHSASKAMATTSRQLVTVNPLSDSPGSLNRDVCINHEKSYFEGCREGSDTRTLVSCCPN